MQGCESVLDKPGQHPKELNPYWKGGGTGLPSECHGSSSATGKLEGRSWMLRMYKRALEQAEQRNVPFEEIAEKQWGSLDKLYSLLHAAGIDPACPDSSFSSSKDKLLYSRSKFDDEKDHRTPTSKFEYGLKTFVKPGVSSRGFLCPSDKDLSVDINDIHSDARNWKVSPKTPAQAPPSPKEATGKVVLPFEVPPSMSTTGVQQESRGLASDQEQVVTEAMINAVSAKLIKAELVGNKEKINRLKLELNDLRSRKNAQDSQNNLVPTRNKSSQDTEKTVLLTSTDRFGRVRPAEVPYVDKSSYRGRSGAKGKSRRDMKNDDYSMSSLMEQERRLTADDTYQAIAKMASKFVRSNPEEVVDDVVDMTTKYNSAKEHEKMKVKVLAESRKVDEIMESCRLCVNGSHFRRHLLVAMGSYAYLSVPPFISLTSGHCQIIPLEHTPCSLQMDENVWTEVKSFQQALTKMFDHSNMDVIFTECYTDPAKLSHMFIDCIPVPKDEGSMAPMYFKKAILESDTEWAQNKKLIDTRQKGLKSSVPLGLPYFFVDFNNEGGFAHVIEDSSLFPHYFAKEVIGGMIDAEPRLWLKPPFENFEQQRRKCLKVKELWAPYDWTHNH